VDPALPGDEVMFASTQLDLTRYGRAESKLSNNSCDSAEVGNRGAYISSMLTDVAEIQFFR